MQIKTRWIKDLSFEGISDEHHVAIDTTVAGGGHNTGMSPKRLLLCSLCACSGIDIVMILKKMKVEYSLLEIVAEAEQTTEDPKVFTQINVTYITDASAEDEAKFKRAVELSQEKYCGISIMLKKHCPINYTIVHK
ncbi:OsmC family protein [Aridibaculum aurantiacum]|uniref:OsmC family protein n=1 Tax=Aridibaculum aurantiacum TaxID=2810307 RepID=UPI001A95C2A0|nr:OsmC family protein [Aridibaculum aurantiacum]